MKRWRRIIVATAMVTAGAAGARYLFRRRRRGPGRHVGLLVALWALLGIDIGDVVDPFGIGGDVVGAIQAAIDVVMGWAQTIFDHIWSFLLDVLRAIRDAALAVAHFASDLVTSLFKWVIHAIGQVASWVMSLLGDLWDQAMKAVRWLGDHLLAAIDAVAHFAGQIVQWVNDNVLGPFVKFVAGIFQWVFDQIMKGLSWLWDRFMPLLDQVMRWLGNQLARLYDLLPKPVRDVIEAAMRAIGWLIWFALHPFDWFHSMIQEAIDHAPGFFAQQVSGAWLQYGPAIEDIISRWIG